MRTIISLNENWTFKTGEKQTTVDVPHCFNALDGTTRDYFRGKVVYEKTLAPTGGSVFLCVDGANSVCSVFCDGILLNTHKGGYSRFVTDITPFANKGCVLELRVDNRDFPDVYPSKADFTFWGGLYRNVSLIVTSSTHFSFKDFSSNGIYATPSFSGGKWKLDVSFVVDGLREEQSILCELFDADGKVFATGQTKKESICLDYLQPILWNGRENPYLYTLRSRIVQDGKVLDEVDTKVGFRTVFIDPDKGFFLNGKHIKLKGVSRHQDRQGMGNGITEKEHKEDIELIMELGANSIRLAHYQQNSYFYDLCDEKGLLVWAEVPVISSFSELKQENAKSQLSELVKQNFNHPSIFCWGIENEITQDVQASKSKKLLPCIKELNSLVKSIDPSRYTTLAQLSILDQRSPLNSITDILGYNHYFGWYDFGFDFLNRWLDEYHKDFPAKKLCLSEYGAEGLVGLHSKNPVQGDYSEEYQCVFHERYLDAISKRDWLWGSYVWNMFDFGASNRREGGVVGKNNKGLVTYDRKIKKDSFYLYKAYWSDESFAHICGERFEKRKTGLYDIKVYSNKNEVTLFVNGKEHTLCGNRVFIFKDVEIKAGENLVEIKNEHSITLFGQSEDESSYRITREQSFVRNWERKSKSEQAFYLSPESTIRELVESKDAHIMVEGKLGKDKLNNPALKLLYPFKIKTMLKLSRLFGLSKNKYELLWEYTYAIRK